MQRRDFYFRQLVTEADLDEVFDLAEQADQNYVVDNGQVGVYSGLDIAEAGVPNLTVQCAAGSAYDQTGQRIAVPSTQIVNVAVDSDNVSTTVAGGGNSKIVSVYIQFDRALSNPKTDGNNVSVQYNRDESYAFIVEQSTEDVAPTPPALKSDAILLADITRTFGVTTIEDSAISTARRQWAISATNGAYEVREGRVEDAIQAVLDVAGNHIVDAVAAHAATAVAFTPAGTIAATTVQAALAELDGDIQNLDADVAAVTTGLSDHLADAVGAHAATAISNTPAGNIAATTVQAALNELDAEKGGLALTNAWLGANSFADGLTVVPTTGTKYIKLRSTAPADATDATLHTVYFRYEATYTSGVGKQVTIFAAADIPNSTQGMFDAFVTFAQAGSAVVSTYQKWTVATAKVAGVMSAGIDGSGATPLSNYAGTGGHQATSVTWTGDGAGGVRLNFTAAGNGRLTVSGAYQISRYDS